MSLPLTGFELSWGTKAQGARSLVHGFLLAASLQQAAASQPVTDDKGGRADRASVGAYEVDQDMSFFPCLLAAVLTLADGGRKAREGGAKRPTWAQPSPPRNGQVFVSGLSGWIYLTFPMALN